MPRAQGCAGVARVSFARHKQKAVCKSLARYAAGAGMRRSGACQFRTACQCAMRSLSVWHLTYKGNTGKTDRSHIFRIRTIRWELGVPPETLQNRMFWMSLQGRTCGVSQEVHPAAGESMRDTSRLVLTECRATGTLP